MATYSSRLEVGKKHLWRDVSEKRLSVLELPHPRILNDGEDELNSLSPRRLVGSAVDALGLVRRFHAHADNVRGIVINLRVVGVNACGFGELCAIARCVRRHRPNEADEVVCVPCFVLWDL